MRSAKLPIASARSARRFWPPAIYIAKHERHNPIDGEMGCKVGMRHGLMRSRIITYISENVKGVAAAGSALTSCRRG